MPLLQRLCCKAFALSPPSPSQTNDVSGGLHEDKVVVVCEVAKIKDEVAEVAVAPLATPTSGEGDVQETTLVARIKDPCAMPMTSAQDIAVSKIGNLNPLTFWSESRLCGEQDKSAFSGGAVPNMAISSGNSERNREFRKQSDTGGGGARQRLTDIAQSAARDELDLEHWTTRDQTIVQQETTEDQTIVPQGTIDYGP